MKRGSKPKPKSKAKAVKAKRQTSKNLAKLFQGLGLEKLNKLIPDLETSSQASVLIKGQRVNVAQALGNAYQARRAIYLRPWNKVGEGCAKLVQPRSKLVGLADLKVALQTSWLLASVVRGLRLARTWWYHRWVLSPDPSRPAQWKVTSVVSDDQHA
jgi:hypothetical protein